MKRARTAALLLVAVLVGGTLGYMLIEGWNLLDAVYMTVITVATVGFREVHPLTEAGHWFTIVLVFAGVGGIAYSIGTIAEFMVEGHLLELLEGRRMAKRIGELRDHYVVVGMGRVGSVVCRTLDEQGVPFIVVDQCEECVSEADENGWTYLQGDATSEEVLEAAGVGRARGLVTALDTDADNLFVALTARGLNPRLYIVARSSSLTSEAKILRAGADRVITPNVIGGRRMATSLLNPLVADYLDTVTHKDELEYRLEALHISERSELAGRSIGEARIRDVTGSFILAISSSGGMDSNPSADRVLKAGDQLVVLGTRSQLDALAALM